MRHTFLTTNLTCVYLGDGLASYGFGNNHPFDDSFMKVWCKVESFIDRFKPEFILLQCGADSIAGDPITHLRFSEKPHTYATERLCKLADKHCNGRLLVMGGGGYNLDNIAQTWLAVVSALSKH